MSYPSDLHPHTGKSRTQYITIVLERHPDADDSNIPLDDFINSIVHGTETLTFPGYRVRDFVPGDYIATAIHNSKGA